MILLLSKAKANKEDENQVVINGTKFKMMLLIFKRLISLRLFILILQNFHVFIMTELVSTWQIRGTQLESMTYIC